MSTGPAGQLMTPPITQEIFIDAPPEVVWRTVTEPASVALWFAHVVDVEPAAGYAGSVTFSGEDTGRGPHTVNVVVDAVEPPRSFSYRWQHPAGEAAVPGNSTLVRFTLTPEGAGTRLRVLETGVDHMTGWTQAQRDDFATDHNAGWTTLLRRCAALLAGPAER